MTGRNDRMCTKGVIDVWSSAGWGPSTAPQYAAAVVVRRSMHPSLKVYVALVCTHLYVLFRFHFV